MVASRSRQLVIVRAAMMPGMAQAKLDNSGMNERPERPTVPIRRSSRKAAPGEVARILKGQDEEEQDQDLRQEDQYAADSGDDAIDQQAAQNRIRHLHAEKAAERFDAALDQLHRQTGPAEHRLEHQEQRCRQDEHSPERMQNQTIDLLVQAGVECRLAHGCGKNPSHFALRSGNVGHVGGCDT